MRLNTLTNGVSALALAIAAPATAQDAAEPDQPEAPAATTSDEIVVRGERLAGSLDVEEQPVLELDAEAIAALGAGSIDELLQAIEPASGSARSGRGGGGGRPVFLVNGVRIGSFREFRSYPPEAIAKVEVFPEETAQRFGFSPDSRVINFVLKDNFTSREVELEYEQPDEGGYSQTEQELSLLTIQDGARINAQFEASQRGLLTESERDLPLVTGNLSDIASDADPRDFRSLVSENEAYQAEVSYARAFIETGSSISLSLTGNRSDSRGLLGLDTVLLTDPSGNRAFRTFNAASPLRSRTRTSSVQSSGSYNTQLGKWQLAATFDAGYSNIRSRIDRRADTRRLRAAALAGTLAPDEVIPGDTSAGFDDATVDIWNAGALATLRGSPILLPAGEVNVTLDAGYDWDRIDSEDNRGSPDTQLTRGDAGAGINVVVPITSRREGFADALGSISLTGQAGVNYLSDFGTLTDWTLGVLWTPFDNLTLNASHIRRTTAPGLTELGNPVIVTPQVPVFDFATGDTVLVDVTTGGNPDLVEQEQADWRFSANWELPFWDDTRLQANFNIFRSNDVTASGIAFTPAFEAAFPDRVTRDADQRLIALDQRPVTLFESRGKSLSLSLTTNGAIGRRPEPAPAPPQTRSSNESRASDAPAREGTSPGGPPAAAMRFDPQAMQAMRAKFCATPEGEQPDLSGIPEPLLARLRDENGEIPPERIAQLREQFCGEAAERRAAEGGERFASIRTSLCAEPPDLDGLPERFRQRLLNEQGEIDPERLAQVRQQVCASDAEPGTEPNAREGGPQGGGGRSGGGRRGGGGGASFFGGDNRDPRPRYFLALTGTATLESEITVSGGGPVLDQLDGFVLSGGAVPDFGAQLEGGLFFQGYGLRVSGRYTSGATLRGNGLPGSTDLFFGDIARLDLRAFVNLGEVFEREEGFLDDLRLSFRVDNVFDTRREVVDANGEVPLAFDPRRTDPIGRFVGIDIRKLF